MSSSPRPRRDSTTSNAAAVKESTIRKMSRLAVEHQAINLSQGFPNEPPPLLLRLQLAHAAVTGNAFAIDDAAIVEDDAGSGCSVESSLRESLIKKLLQDETEQGNISATDVVNQYSPPMGRLDVRQAIADYYQRFYQYQVSPDDITVTLGATEAFAAALRAVGRPGDRCVVFEPFHELYPSQCQIFYLEPVFVTLRNNNDATGRWTYDPQELREALSQARILILNSPHNPTGKVFSKAELTEIVDWCIEYNVYIITDEIYEHMCYGTNSHIFLPKAFSAISDRTLACNSIGKSASATGWRVGWCLHPPHVSDTYRGIHDQLAVMSPHPMQYATLSFLTLPDTYFESLARRYQERVAMMVVVLTDLGFRIALPEGAYYLFVDYKSVPALADKSSMEAAMFLLTVVGVACVPGDNFYGKAKEDGQNYLRFAACRSVSDLTEASRRLSKLKAMVDGSARSGEKA